MAIKIDEVIKHFENLYKNSAIYVWGCNGEIITQQLCNKLYNSFKSATYNKAYYQNKYKEGKGKIGADCSGAFYPVSGFDTTAQGYYNRCTRRGVITDIPRDTPCMVFKGKSASKITHIGFYIGGNTVIEMKSSKDNCVKDKLDGKGWKWYGIPDWIDYSDYQISIQPPLNINSTKKDIQRFLNTYYGNEIKKVIGALLEVDGDIGTKSKKAIAIAFQVELNRLGADLKVDGSFGSKTEKAFDKYVGTLKKNSKSIFVTLWQCLLVGNNFKPNGGIDGSYGNGTLAATNGLFEKLKMSKDNTVSGNDLNKIL